MTASIFPTTLRALLRLLAAVLLVAATNLSFASEGHDHGDAPLAATGTASPRLAAHSDLFELVGVVDKGQMTVYLDRYATNEPVTGARIEFEAGSNKGVAQPQADGTYLIKFDALARTGELPFSFTVAAGADTDLLAGDLELKAPHEAHEDAQRPWLRWAGYTLAGAFALALLIFATRRFRTSRPARVEV